MTPDERPAQMPAASTARTASDAPTVTVAPSESAGTPASHATGRSTPLATLEDGSFVSAGDALIARRIVSVVGDQDDTWAAAVLALAIRSVRDGSTALALDSLAGMSTQGDRDDDELQTTITTIGDLLTPPSAPHLADELRASQLVARSVMHVEDDVVYLDRYVRDERIIAELLRERTVAAVDDEALTRARGALADRRLDAAQREAVESALRSPTTVLTGGPGMGKTYTVAAMLVAARAALGDDTRIALAAPTGKAAARMAESLREAGVLADNDALTLHRLLGFDARNRQRFVHGRANPLPHDVVVVDEASMVSLSLMARLLEALKPSARLVLVGDPDQLVSVEAGSVLGDLVDGLDAEVVRLVTHHRLTAGRAAVAEAFRRCDDDARPASARVLDAIDRPQDGVEFLETDDPTLEMLPHLLESAWRLREVAMTGDSEAAVAQLRAGRLLAAHRTGPYGVARWNRLIEQALAERAPEVAAHAMYVGRPVLVTKNERALGLFNGDSGVVVRRDGALLVAIETATGVREFSPWRLADLVTMHALTVHKAQGSQAEHVTVLVPPVGSRLLNREMIYTALTRATDRLTVVGSREAIVTAVETPTLRASGLGRRLRTMPRGQAATGTRPVSSP